MGSQSGGQQNQHRSLTVFTLADPWWPGADEKNEDGCWLGHRLRADLLAWIERRDILIINATAQYGYGFPLTVSDQRYGNKPPEHIRGKPKCHVRDCNGFAIQDGHIVDPEAGWREFFEIQRGHWWGRANATSDDALGNSEAASDDIWAGGKVWQEVTAPAVASRFREVWVYCFDDRHADLLMEAICGLNRVAVNRTVLRPTDLRNG